MTFVDSHQDAFASHGVCTRANTDPDFDLGSTFDVPAFLRRQEG